MMDFSTFCECMRQRVEALLGRRCAIEQKRKNNGMVLTGVVMNDPSAAAAQPIIYLDETYGNMVNAQIPDEYVPAVLDRLAPEIADTIMRYQPAMTDGISMIGKSLSDYETAKAGIAAVPVNMERNRDMLDSVPHVPYLDLAVTFHYISEMEDGHMSTTITNEMMEAWGIGTKELIHNAMDLTPKVLGGFRIQRIRDILYPDCPADDTRDGMYVCRAGKCYGASAILFPELLRTLADRIDDELYVVPSSTEEIILLGKMEFENHSDKVRQLTREINEMMVREDEYLSDTLYLYSRLANSVLIPVM